jgi:hypothetical protein
MNSYLFEAKIISRPQRFVRKTVNFLAPQKPGAIRLPTPLRSICIGTESAKHSLITESKYLIIALIHLA